MSRVTTVWLPHAEHGLQTRHCAECFVFVSSILAVNSKIDRTLFLDLEMWALRLRVVKSLALSGNVALELTLGQRESITGSNHYPVSFPQCCEGGPPAHGTL